MTKIPMTKRYCTVCEQYRWYKIGTTGHSFCTECGAGSMFARRTKPKDKEEAKTK